MKVKTTSPPALPAAYRRLRDRLSQVNWIALGSVLERRRPGQGGPRHQWSRRVGRKTVTLALSAEQFAWLKEAIANQRVSLAVTHWLFFHTSSVRTRRRPNASYLNSLRHPLVNWSKSS